jgi:hypothetical protein
MKTILALVLIVLFAVYLTASRHIREQNEINLTEAIEHVQAFAKKLAIAADKPLTGKLHKSWSGVSKENFKLVKEKSETYTILASNTQNNETLYFIIDKKGHILEVMREDYFKSPQNHTR